MYVLLHGFLPTRTCVLCTLYLFFPENKPFKVWKQEKQPTYKRQIIETELSLNGIQLTLLDICKYEFNVLTK